MQEHPLPHNHRFSDHDCPALPLACVCTCSSIKQWFESFAVLSDMPREERLQLLVAENDWKNDLVWWMFPAELRAQLPRLVQSWVRNWILCAAVFHGVRPPPCLTAALALTGSTGAYVPAPP